MAFHFNRFDLSPHELKLSTRTPRELGRHLRDKLVCSDLRRSSSRLLFTDLNVVCNMPSFPHAASLYIRRHQFSVVLKNFPTHHFFSRRPGRSVPLTQGREKVSERTPRRAALTSPFRPLELGQGLRDYTKYAVQNYIRNGQLRCSVSFDDAGTHGNPMSLSWPRTQSTTQ